MKYLDNNGLLYLWQKITNKINSNGLLNESVIGWNGTEIPEGYEEVSDPNTAIKQEIYNSMFPIGRGFIDFTGADFTNYLGFKWERELVGMTPIGYKEGDADFGAIGNTGGEKTHTLTESELPKISSSIALADNIVTNVASASLVHKLSGNALSVTNYEGATRPYNNGVSYATTTYARQINLNIGGGQAHNNLPPYKVVSYWKRVA